MSKKWSEEEWKGFVVGNWDRWQPAARVTCRVGAPVPRAAKADYVAYLGAWAERVEWPDPEMPTIEKDNGGFLIRRRSTREDTRRESIYTALGTVIQECLLRQGER
jgi:hypothetical protein